VADTLTTIQYSMERQETALNDLTTKFFKEPIAGMFRDGNGITTLEGGGRGLIRYFNDLLYPGGGFGQVPSGGDYPAAQAESEIQPYQRLYHYAMTIGYTEEALKALESTPRGKVLQQLQSKLRGAVEHHQRRIARSCMGRGDGVVARASGAHSSVTSFTSSIPLRLVIGDIVYAKVDTAGAGRGIGGTTEIDGIRVTSVNPVDKTFTLASAQTCTDNAVFYLLNAAHNAGGAGVYPQGVEAMYDDAANDNTQWDADDSATYDHVDTYLAQTRSSVGQANCIVYNMADSPNLSNIGAMVARALAVGASPEDLFLLCNDTVYQTLADTIVGFAPRLIPVKLPGGTYKIPVLDRSGQAEIKVICDWGMPDDHIVLIDGSRVYRLTCPGGWNKRTGSMWKQNAAASSGPFAAAVTAAFDSWFGLACNLPDTSVLAYGVTTT
jgi:hypothetical protein